MLKLTRADNSKLLINFASSTGLWLFLTGILGPATAIGNEINTPDKAGNTGRFTSLVLDAKGYPVISYHDLTRRDLKLLHCDNPNCAGNESGGISTVDSTGIVGTYTSLALDKNGKPVISYYDAS